MRAGSGADEQTRSTPFAAVRTIEPTLKGFCVSRIRATRPSVWRRRSRYSLQLRRRDSASRYLADNIQQSIAGSRASRVAWPPRSVASSGASLHPGSLYDQIRRRRHVAVGATGEQLVKRPSTTGGLTRCRRILGRARVSGPTCVVRPGRAVVAGQVERWFTSTAQTRG
jgi:hypothetical protein